MTSLYIGHNYMSAEDTGIFLICVSSPLNSDITALVLEYWNVKANGSVVDS